LPPPPLINISPWIDERKHVSSLIFFKAKSCGSCENQFGLVKTCAMVEKSRNAVSDAFISGSVLPPFQGK
jgi:hypothetical protein